MTDMFKGFISHPRVGISFMRRAITAIRVRRSWRGQAYEDHVRQDVENLLEPEGGYSILAAALRDVVRHLAVPGAVLRIAIPGPLVQTTALRVEERPKSRGEAEALIAWHVARQTGADRPRRTAAHCISGSSGDYRLYGIAVDETLCRCLEKTLAAENQALEVVEAAATCRWNSLPALVRGQPGVLVDILDGYWTLMLWEESSHPLLVKSGWRDSEGGAAESGRMAREVFRLLASAGRADGAGQTECYYLLARPEEAGSTGDALRETIGHSFEMLAAGTGTAGVRGLPVGMAGCPAVEIACA